MKSPEKTSAEEFGQHLPGTLIASSAGPAWQDVFVEIYTRRRVEECLLVPAVAEPQIVWILSGSALVEQREFGGTWSGRSVTIGEFFLTTTTTPYELRWRVTSPGDFQTMLTYVGLPLFARAHRDVLGVEMEAPRLREVFAEQDAVLTALLEQLRSELTTRRGASRLFVQGIAQSLAVHVVRTYPAPSSSGRVVRGGLPAFKLQKITGLIEAHLDEEIARRDSPGKPA
jgi:AraC family transcriptional regulator